MKRLLVGISLFAIVSAATYVAINSGEKLWFAVAATGVLGIAGMVLCLKRSRYAALFAAITLLMITGAAHGLHVISGTVDSDATGHIAYELRFEGPSLLPTLFGAVALLAFQGLLEIVERQPFQGMFSSMNLSWIKSAGPDATTVAHSTIGDRNTGQIAIGSGNTQIQFNTDIDSEIQSAADLLKDGKILSAKNAFSNLWKRYGSSLSDHQRYRISANLGIIASKTLQHQRAATLFDQAAELADDKNLADRWRAHAASQRGDRSAAVEIAQTVLDNDPTDKDAAALRILNDESSAETAEIRARLCEEIRNSIEVLHSCTVRESVHGRFELAERFAREANENHADNFDIQTELARAIVCRIQKKHGSHSRTEELSTVETEDLVYSIDLASAVIRSQTELDRTEVYSIRALARSLLGLRVEALADWAEAAASNKSIEKHLIPYALHLQEAGRKDDAIQLLKTALEKSSDLAGAIIYAELLRERNEPGDLNVAERALEDAIQKAVEVSSSDLCCALVELSQVLVGKANRFKDRLAETCRKLSDFGLRVVNCSFAIAQGNREEADFHASMAILELPTAADEYEVGQLAILFKQLERYAECANLLAGLCPTNRDSRQVRLLLDAARDAKLDTLVLQQSRGLRNHGVYAGYLVRSEAAVLSKYLAIDALTDLLDDFDRHCSGSSVLNWLRYVRSLAAVHIGYLEFVEPDPQKLPSAADIHLDDLSNLCKVLRYGAGIAVAIGQVYSLLRKNRSSPRIQQAFFALMSLADDHEQFDDPKTVCPGVAVLVTNASGVEKWYIIEDGDNPDSTQDEFAPDSAAVRPFIGKEVGDTVIFAHGPSADRFTIRQIMNKRNFTKVRIMETYPDAHPDDGFLIRYDTAGPDGEIDPRILGVQIGFWEERKAQSVEDYRRDVIPLVWLANAVNRPLASAWNHVAQTRELPFRVRSGEQNELDNVHETVSRNLPLVLGPTAAMTLLYTGFWRSMNSCGFDIVVPRAVLNDVWCLIADSPYRLDGGSTLRVLGDVPFIAEGNLEGWARHRFRVGQFLIWIQLNCRVVDCLALARISPARRELLEGLFGFSTASAIAVAADIGGALWTDDLPIAQVAREFGVAHRVWTLAVADECIANTSVEASVVLDLKTEMLGYGAVNLPLENAVFVLAGERTRWDPSEQPLRTICDWFANHRLRPEIVLGTLEELVVATHDNEMLWHQESATCRAMFSATRRRPDGDRLLRFLYARVPKLFRFEVVHQEKIRALIAK